MYPVCPDLVAISAGVSHLAYHGTFGVTCARAYLVQGRREVWGINGTGKSGYGYGLRLQTMGKRDARQEHGSFINSASWNRRREDSIDGPLERSRNRLDIFACGFPGT